MAKGTEYAFFIHGLTSYYKVLNSYENFVYNMVRTMPDGHTEVPPGFFFMEWRR